MSIFGNRSYLPLIFSARAIARRRKAWFRLRVSRILFAAKHSWTTLRMTRPLFVGSYFAGHLVGFRPMKRKKNLHRMIIKVVPMLRKKSYPTVSKTICLFRIPLCLTGGIYYTTPEWTVWIAGCGFDCFKGSGANAQLIKMLGDYLLIERLRSRLRQTANVNLYHATKFSLQFSFTVKHFYTLGGETSAPLFI